MKKYYFLIIVALILCLVLTGCSLLSNVGQVPSSEQSGIAYLTKGTETAPDVFTLYAGQHIDVGTVSVWNDAGDFLYVKYNTTGGWVMTETHLHVFLDDDEYIDVPQKNGNPIPGKFDYKGEHAYETEVLYEIPLTWDPATELFIAAHAKVIRPIEGCWETVWQIGDVEVVNIGTSWLENYADEFNWGDPAGPITMGPSLTVEEPSFTDPFIVGTTPPDDFPYNSNYVKGYATEFDVQWNGSLPFGGLLTISWSPGASASEKKVVSEDGIIPTTLTATGATSSGQGWFMDKYPLVNHSVNVNPLSDGLHTINFQHTLGDGTFWDWIRLEKPCVQEETAWAANGEDPGYLPFPGKNWATYFNYIIQPVLVDTVDVYANNTLTTYSSVILESGKNYQLKASGTAFAGDTIWFDAKYSNSTKYSSPIDSWTDDVAGYTSYGPNLLGLSVDGAFVNWGVYNNSHIYDWNMVGGGSPVALVIYDIYYPNNTGFLTVEIYWTP